MNKVKYLVSFMFVMIITSVVVYVVYSSSKEKTVRAANQNDYDGVKEIAQSGFFGEFENFLSSYDETTNTTAADTTADTTEDTTDTVQDIIIPNYGEEVGTISIASIALSSRIFYGDDSPQLSQGVGIDPRQKIPGQNGNVILAGHNNMAFGTLGNLQIGDEVILNTNYGMFKYRVENYRVTQYDDLTVIVPKDYEYLTMYTCYPFDQYTPTNTRFVVTCTFVGRE